MLCGRAYRSSFRSWKGVSVGAYTPIGFYRNKPRVKISEGFCRGCLNCVSVCPLKGQVLRACKLNGEVRAKVEHSERCVGCGRCVNSCPTHSISIYLV